MWPHCACVWALDWGTLVACFVFCFVCLSLGLARQEDYIRVLLPPPPRATPALSWSTDLLYSVGLKA